MLAQSLIALFLTFGMSTFARSQPVQATPLAQPVTTIVPLEPTEERVEDDVVSEKICGKALRLENEQRNAVKPVR